MKKKILSLLLMIGVAFGMFSGCEKPVVDPPTIDYAASVTLDMTSETKKEKATVKTFIDGDTTHFNVSKSISVDNTGVLKARYLAINTPESTGKIEEWGKTASNFTKSKLQTATSIILETDGAEWELDSTGGRHLVWVWYKTAEMTDYRNLNIEILQNGLAIASNSEGNRYGETCGAAIAQATRQKLHVYSGEKDPNFYYGEAQPLTLKELRLNVVDYVDQKVAFEGVLSYLYDGGAYFENYDEETGLWFGMYVYYGFSTNPFLESFFLPKNKFRIVGSVTEFNGSYQVSGIQYDMRNPDDPASCKLLEENVSFANVETSIDTWYSKVPVGVEDAETGEVVTTEYDYNALTVCTSISMKNLKVIKTYSTMRELDDGTKVPTGEITITCQYGNQEIDIRTSVLKDEDGKVITEDKYKNKTIDVMGVIDYFKWEERPGVYQIKVFNFNNITIH